MEYFKSGIIYILIIMIGVIVFKNVLDQKALRGKIRDAQNALALVDSVRIENDSTISRLTTNLKGFARLKEEKGDLTALLETRDADIRYWSNLSFEWKDRALSGEGKDTVYVDSSGVSIHRVDFEATKGSIEITGYTLSPPGTYDLIIKQSKIGLSIVLTEEGDAFRTYVEFSDPYIKAGEIQANVNFKEPGFWDKFKLVGGIDINRLNILAGAKYNGYMGGLMFHPEGTSVWLAKEWKLK